jgi:transcription termination factor Rho
MPPRGRVPGGNPRGSTCPTSIRCFCPDLKKLAGSLGVKSTGLRKAELAAAIKATQSGGQRCPPHRPRRGDPAPRVVRARRPRGGSSVERARRERARARGRARAAPSPRAPQAAPFSLATRTAGAHRRGRGDDVASRLEALAAEGPRRNATGTGRGRSRLSSAPPRPPVEEPRQHNNQQLHATVRSARSDSYDDDSQGGRRNRRRRNRDRNNRRSAAAPGADATQAWTRWRPSRP